MEYSVHLNEARWIKKRCRPAEAWKKGGYPPWMCDMLCGEVCSFVMGFLEALNPKASYHMTKSMYKFGDPFCEKIVTIYRVPTGDTSVDELLFGGMPEGYAVLLLSPVCDERTRFLEGFIKHSVLDGRPACYLTSDPRGVLDLAASYPKFMRLILCHSMSDQVAQGRENVYAVRGAEVLSHLNASLMDAIQSMESGEEKGIACCDILSDILSQHGAGTTKKWLADVLQRLKGRGFTALSVLNPDVHSKSDIEALRELFDGEFRVSQEEQEGRTRALFRVTRMYQQNFQDREIILE
ncbi:MAG: hypothetical protein ACE5OY_08800 [Candidatus Bathyarchaeia archaeon]